MSPFDAETSAGDEKIRKEQERIDRADDLRDYQVKIGNTPAEDERLTETYMGKVDHLRGRIRDLRSKAEAMKDANLVQGKTLADVCRTTEQELLKKLVAVPIVKTTDAGHPALASSAIRTVDQIKHAEQFNDDLEDFLARTREAEHEWVPHFGDDRIETPDAVAAAGRLLTDLGFSGGDKERQQAAREILGRSGRGRVETIARRVAFVGRFDEDTQATLFGKVLDQSALCQALQTGASLNSFAYLLADSGSFESPEGRVRAARAKLRTRIGELQEQVRAQQKRIDDGIALLAKHTQQKADDAQISLDVKAIGSSREALSKLQFPLLMMRQAEQKMELALLSQEVTLERHRGRGDLADRMLLRALEENGEDLRNMDPDLWQQIVGSGTEEGAFDRIRKAGKFSEVEQRILAEHALPRALERYAVGVGEVQTPRQRFETARSPNVERIIDESGRTVSLPFITTLQVPGGREVVVSLDADAKAFLDRIRDRGAIPLLLRDIHQDEELRTEVGDRRREGVNGFLSQDVTKGAYREVTVHRDCRIRMADLACADGLRVIGPDGKDLPNVLEKALKDPSDLRQRADLQSPFAREVATRRAREALSIALDRQRSAADPRVDILDQLRGSYGLEIGPILTMRERFETPQSPSITAITGAKDLPYVTTIRTRDGILREVSLDASGKIALEQIAAKGGKPLLLRSLHPDDALEAKTSDQLRKDRGMFSVFSTDLNAVASRTLEVSRDCRLTGADFAYEKDGKTFHPDGAPVDPLSDRHALAVSERNWQRAFTVLPFAGEAGSNVMLSLRSSAPGTVFALSSDGFSVREGSGTDAKRMRTIRTQAGKVIAGVALTPAAEKLLSQEPPAGFTLTLKREPNEIVYGNEYSNKDRGTWSETTWTVASYDTLDAGDFVYAREEGGQLQMRDALPGSATARVSVADLEHNQEQSTRDILRILDKDPPVVSVSQAASRTQQAFLSAQTLCQAGTIGRRREEFVQFAQQEAKPLLDLLNSSDLKRDLKETTDHLLLMKEKLKTGVALGGLEREVDARLQALDQFTKLVTDPATRNMVETLLDPAKFGPETFKHWWEQNWRPLVAGIAVCATTIATFGALGIALPTIVSLGFGQVGFMVGSEYGMELTYHAFNDDPEAKAKGLHYSPRMKLMAKMEGDKVYDAEKNQYVDLEWMKDVVNPYAQELCMSLLTSSLMIGLGSATARELSTLVQNSVFLQRALTQRPLIRSITTFLWQMDGAMAGGGVSAEAKSFLQLMWKDMWGQIRFQVDQHLFEKVFSIISEDAGHLAAFAVTVAHGFRPLKGNKSFSYARSGPKARTPEQARAQLVADGHTILSEREGTFQTRGKDGSLCTFAPEGIADARSRIEGKPQAKTWKVSDVPAVPVTVPKAPPSAPADRQWIPGESVKVERIGTQKTEGGWQVIATREDGRIIVANEGGLTKAVTPEQLAKWNAEPSPNPRSPEEIARRSRLRAQQEEFMSYPETPEGLRQRLARGEELLRKEGLLGEDESLSVRQKQAVLNAHSIPLPPENATPEQVRELMRSARGVLLMADINPDTVTSLEKVLDAKATILRKGGLTFKMIDTFQRAGVTGILTRLKSAVGLGSARNAEPRFSERQQVSVIRSNGRREAGWEVEKCEPVLLVEDHQGKKFVVSQETAATNPRAFRVLETVPGYIVVKKEGTKTSRKALTDADLDRANAPDPLVGRYAWDRHDNPVFVDTILPDGRYRVTAPGQDFRNNAIISRAVPPEELHLWKSGETVLAQPEGSNQVQQYRVESRQAYSDGVFYELKLAGSDSMRTFQVSEADLLQWNPASAQSPPIQKASEPQSAPRPRTDAPPDAVVTQKTPPIALREPGTGDYWSNAQAPGADSSRGKEWKAGQTVKVRRSNGESEEGWQVAVERADGYFLLAKGNLTKIVSPEDLAQWNAPPASPNRPPEGGSGIAGRKARLQAAEYQIQKRLSFASLALGEREALQRSLEQIHREQQEIAVTSARSKDISILKDYLKSHDVDAPTRVRLAEELLGHPLTPEQAIALEEAHKLPGAIDQGDPLLNAAKIARLKRGFGESPEVYERDIKPLLDAGLAGSPKGPSPLPPPPPPPSRKSKGSQPAPAHSEATTAEVVGPAIAALTYKDCIIGERIGQGGNSNCYAVKNHPEVVVLDINSTGFGTGREIDTARTIMKLQQKVPAGVCIARIISVEQIAGKTLVLMEKAEGTALHDRGNTEYARWSGRIQALADAPQSHFDKLVADIRKIQEAGLAVDPSKPDNLFYDSGKGFSFIDLTPRGGSQVLDTIGVPIVHTSVIFGKFNGLVSAKDIGNIRTIFAKLSRAGAPQQRERMEQIESVAARGPGVPPIRTALPEPPLSPPRTQPTGARGEAPKPAPAKAAVRPEEGGRLPPGKPAEVSPEVSQAFESFTLLSQLGTMPFSEVRRQLSSLEHATLWQKKGEYARIVAEREKAYRARHPQEKSYEFTTPKAFAEHIKPELDAWLPSSHAKSKSVDGKGFSLRYGDGIPEKTGLNTFYLTPRFERYLDIANVLDGALKGENASVKFNLDIDQSDPQRIVVYFAANDYAGANRFAKALATSPDLLINLAPASLTQELVTFKIPLTPGITYVERPGEASWDSNVNTILFPPVHKNVLDGPTRRWWSQRKEPTQQEISHFYRFISPTGTQNRQMPALRKNEQAPAPLQPPRDPRSIPTYAENLREAYQRAAQVPLRPPPLPGEISLEKRREAATKILEANFGNDYSAFRKENSPFLRRAVEAIGERKFPLPVDPFTLSPEIQQFIQSTPELRTLNERIGRLTPARRALFWNKLLCSR